MTNKEILANYEKMKNECFETRKLNDNLGELVVKKNRIIADLEEKLANADYQLEGRDNEIRELNEKIEKMKCCENCAFQLVIGGVRDSHCVKCNACSEWELTD